MAEDIYKIECKYRTGDSFNTYDETYKSEMTWGNLDNAKEALKRIKEHYLWYDSKNSRYAKKHSKPKWHNLKYDFCLKLPLDNGKEVQIFAPWCGYFETLYGAKIITEEDSDMSFTISDY